MLSGLVQRLALGSVLLDLGHLFRGEFRVLGQSFVDLLHVGGTMEGPCPGRKQQRCNSERDAFHRKISRRVKADFAERQSGRQSTAGTGSGRNSREAIMVTWSARLRRAIGAALILSACAHPAMVNAVEPVD